MTAVMHQRTHLALIALALDEAVEIERHHVLDGVRRQDLAVGAPLPDGGIRKALPMRLAALAQGGDQAAAGDPDFARHGACAQARMGVSRPRRRACSSTSSRIAGVGKGIVRKRIPASATGPVLVRMAALVTA